MTRVVFLVQASISPGLLEELIKLSEDLEKYIRPLSEADCASPGGSSTLEKELKSIGEQLQKGEEKCKELEAKNIELQGLTENKVVNGVGEQQVGEELKSLEKDMEKKDMHRFGRGLTDGQATENSFYLDQRDHQTQVG